MKAKRTGPVVRTRAIQSLIAQLDAALRDHGIPHVPRTTPLPPGTSTILSGDCETSCPACVHERQIIAARWKLGGIQRDAWRERDSADLASDAKRTNNRRDRDPGIITDESIRDALKELARLGEPPTNEKIAEVLGKSPQAVSNFLNSDSS